MDSLTMEKNDFQVLGITEEFSEEVLKKAYRDKVKEFHPDLSENQNKVIAHLSMIRINQAYNNLRGMITGQENLITPQKKKDHKIDYAYENYKKGYDIYTTMIEALLSAKTTELEAFGKIVKELPEAYYYFSMVVNEFSESVWAFDSMAKMKYIEKMTPQYTRILKSIKKEENRNQ